MQYDQDKRDGELPDAAKLEFIFSIVRSCMSCMDFHKHPQQTWQQVAQDLDTNCENKKSAQSGMMADDFMHAVRHDKPQCFFKPDFFASGVADGDVVGTLNLFAHGQRETEISVLTGQRYRISPGVHFSQQAQSRYDREKDAMIEFALRMRSVELRF